jgi:hypothetical protein
MIEILGLPELSHPSWAALWKYHRLEWFSRVWVMQEFIVSPEALVLVGDYGIDWDIIGVAPFWLSRNGILRSVGSRWKGSNASALHFYRTERRSSKLRPFPKSFLYASDTWFASDLRDKVLAS